MAVNGSAMDGALPRLAFVFPGQGAQSVGMGQALAAASPAAAAVFRAADQALGYRLSDLCFAGPASDLQRTEVTQPALLTVGEACRAALLEQLPGLAPFCAAGLSLGEYGALVAAESLAFADAVRLVRLRGRYMQEAVPEGEGAMTAIVGLDEAAVRRVCDAAATHGVVIPANINAPGQIVISGESAAVAAAGELARAAGAKRVVPLAVSAPFHSPLMAPAGERLATELERMTVLPAAFSVYANVDACPVTSPEQIRANLVAQVSASVLWVRSVEEMIADGATHFIEFGPGRTLAAMIRRIDRSVWVGSIEDPASLAEVAAELRSVVGPAAEQPQPQAQAQPSEKEYQL